MIKLSKDVFLDDELTYIIKLDGHDLCTTDSEETAKKMLQSVAEAEMLCKRGKVDAAWTVYSLDVSKDQERVTIYRQDLGRAWNGRPYVDGVLHVERVSKGHWIPSAPVNTLGPDNLPVVAYVATESETARAEAASAETVIAKSSTSTSESSSVNLA